MGLSFLRKLGILKEMNLFQEVFLLPVENCLVAQCPDLWMIGAGKHKPDVPHAVLLKAWVLKMGLKALALLFGDHQITNIDRKIRAELCCNRHLLLDAGYDELSLGKVGQGDHLDQLAS